MRGTTIFLAGAEVETLTRALLDNGVKHILYSYFYIWQMKRERFIEDMQSQYPEVEWFLDSGAFTYLSKWQLEPHKLPPPKSYAKHFFKYIDRQGHNFCRIAELDIDRIDGVGEEQVDEWREYMLERWPHLNIVPVWHATHGTAKWRAWCRDPRIRYLAVSSSVADIPMMRRLAFEAAKHGKFVHGLAQTKTEVFKRVPFDSADSTSWLSGQKFGTMYAFRHNKMEQLNKDQGKALRRQLRGYFQAIGCDPELMNDESSHLTRLSLKRGIPFDQLRKMAIAEIRKGNVLAWKMLSDRMDYLRAKMIERSGTTLPFILRGPPQERTEEDERGLIAKLFGTPETETREPEYVEALERKIAPRPFGRQRLVEPFLWDDLDDRNPHMAE